MPEVHGFAQDGDGDDYGYQRVDVAEDGGFLAGELLQGGEVHAVGDAGVYKTHDEKIDPADSIHAAQGNTAGEGHVGHQNQNGGQKLQEGAVDAFHIFDEFVQQDDRCIQHRRAKTEQNAGEMSAAGADIADAGDQHQTQRGHREAQHLLSGELFVKKHRAHRRDDDRRKVIAERCHRYGGVFVCLKQ